MRILNKFLIIIIFLFLGEILNPQEIKFTPYITSSSFTDNRTNLYAWSKWESVNGLINIIIDLNNNKIIIGNNEYEIVERPSKWIVKKDVKYVTFSCASSSLESVDIKLYEYDNGNFKINVNEIKQGTRYMVKYENGK